MSFENLQRKFAEFLKSTKPIFRPRQTLLKRVRRVGGTDKVFWTFGEEKSLLMIVRPLHKNFRLRLIEKKSLESFFHPLRASEVLALVDGSICHNQFFNIMTS